MRKHIFFLIMLLLPAILSFSQTGMLSVYQSIGANVSKNALKKDSGSTLRKAGFGWDNRLIFEFSFGSKISIGTGFGYSLHREKTKNYVLTDLFGKKIAETDLISETNSLNIPVFFKYIFTKSSFEPYVKIGLRNVFLTKIHTYCGRITLTDPAYDDDIKFYSILNENTISGNDFIDFEMNRYLIGPELSIGFTKYFGDHIFFGSELTIHRSIRNLHTKSEPMVFAQSCSLSVTAGINF